MNRLILKIILGILAVFSLGLLVGFGLPNLEQIPVAQWRYVMLIVLIVVVTIGTRDTFRLAKLAEEYQVLKALLLSHSKTIEDILDWQSKHLKWGEGKADELLDLMRQILKVVKP